MSFLTDLADRISGKSKQISYEEALATQKAIAEAAIAQQNQQDLLKYSPELSKQRTIQVAVVSISVIVGIVILVYIFK